MVEIAQYSAARGNHDHQLHLGKQPADGAGWHRWQHHCVEL